MSAAKNLREVRFKRLLWGTALVPIALTLAGSLLLARLVARLLDDAQWVDHTDQVIGQARRCKESGLAMESSLRAFQLTGLTNYARAYWRHSSEIQSSFSQLQLLIADNPEQVRRLENIRAQFSRWSNRAAMMLERLPANQKIELEVLESGTKDFEHFILAFDEFVRIEEALREQRNNALAQLDGKVRAWRTVILLAAGLAGSWFLWRQLKSIAGLYLQSEAAALHRAEILQTTLASIGDGVIATDDKGQITFLNGMAERLTGWTSNEAQGKPLREVFDICNERTRQPAQDPVSKVLEKGLIVGLANHTVLRSRDGRELPIADSGSPIRDKSDRIWGVVLVFRDCTQHRRAYELQSYLAAIVQSSDDAIISKDLNGTITAWNNGAERLFGFKAAEAIGRPITLFIPPERQQEEPVLLESIKRGQPIEHYQTVRLHKDGRPVEVSLTISPIRDEEGKVIGASKIARDISRQKADEQALRQARDELEQRVVERTSELTTANERLQEMDRFRSEFLATMSHELRTPLNSILGFTEIIKGGRAGPVTDKQMEYLAMAHASAKHLLNLINDLLDVSRIEAGKDQLFIEAFQVQPLVHEALQTVQMMAQRKNVALTTHLDVPAPIYSDRKKVYQIILNLLSNAVKFTEHGEIRLEAHAQHNQLTVMVSDTGIGMTAEQLSSLFEAFGRAENSARRVYEGTGLGLYLCKKLVTLLGGEIHAESQRGKGSRFSFSIPIKPPIRSHG